MASRPGTKPAIGSSAFPSGKRVTFSPNSPLPLQACEAPLPPNRAPFYPPTELSRSEVSPSSPSLFLCSLIIASLPNQPPFSFFQEAEGSLLKNRPPSFPGQRQRFFLPAKESLLPYGERIRPSLHRFGSLSLSLLGSSTSENVQCRPFFVWYADDAPSNPLLISSLRRIVPLGKGSSPRQASPPPSPPEDRPPFPNIRCCGDSLV